MEAIEMIKTRRSVRKFKDEIVDRETMSKIMDATRFAPSWANYQVARYTLVTNPEVIAKISNEAVNGFVYNINTLKKAKNVAIVSFVEGKSGKFELDKDYVTKKANTWETFDAGISVQTFCLAAHNYGVGTVIMGMIDAEQIKEITKIPEEETVACVIVYGYNEDGVEVPVPERKSVEEISRFVD